MRRGIALLLLALLAGCQSVPAPVATHAALGDAAQAAREQQLAAQPVWQLRGRVAVAQNGQGGSAGIVWSQQGERFEIELAAPITGQRWRLHGDLDGATLDGLASGPQHGADAEALLFEATGWRLPVRDLPAWVRGTRGAGPADMAYDASGRPHTLAQSGWQVEYRDWHAGSPPLPRRLFARQGEASVRLVVESWQ